MATSDNPRGSSNPTSTLLQDMLREKKAQTQRTKKTYDANDNSGDRQGGREVQSSPISSRDKLSTPSRRATGVGIRQPSMPKEMSYKEMEQHLSKVNKQNFDLKLEIFHRRQRNEVLEAKVEKLEEVEADNAEMQSINEDLLFELEKRDLAIQEAVNLICELEGKIEEMGEAEMYFRDAARTPETIGVADAAEKNANDSPLDRRPSAGSPDVPEDSRLEISPIRLRNMSPKPEASARRIPSFMQDKRASTNVLRSLYSYDGSIRGPGSVLSGDVDEEEEAEDEDMVHSPRLSILSESGFMSIYGDAKNSEQTTPRQTDVFDAPETTTSELPRAFSSRDTQRDARIQKWVEERKRPSTPTRASSKTGNNDRFSSIGEVLGKVPSSAKPNEVDGHDNVQEIDRKTQSPAKSEKKGRAHQRRPSSPAFGGPMFGGAMLPPTPGTMSTATIAASSSTLSIVTEKSLLDGTPLPAKGLSALVPDRRPQSSESNLAIDLGNALAAEEDSEQEHHSSPSSRSQKAGRPSLTTSATDIVFSGEGYASVMPSRTLSYPSPTSANHHSRAPGHLSPTSEKSSKTHSSSQTQKDRSNNSVTPTRKSARETQSSLSPPKPDLSTPTAGSSKPKPPTDHTSGLRFKMNKISRTPSQSTHQSVASRLFRRNQNQSAHPSINNTEPTSPQPPPVPPKSPTARSQKERPPRPTSFSLYGSSPIYGQRPPVPTSRPSSSRSRNEHIGREHVCESHRKYELNSLLPDARPGTADIDKSDIKPIKNVRRHSAIVVDKGAEDLLLGDADQRDTKDSRQIVRPDASKGKWALGRTTSARIKEGLGFKRSMSTQDV
ncbi:hypothetical protein ACLMJK_005533 [Lecanora helva]